MIVYPPFWLLISSEECWKCGLRQKVVGLAASSCDELRAEERNANAPPSDFITLSNVQAMPDEVLEFIRSVHQRYELRESRGAGNAYLANVCECGAMFGDFYLFSEPEGAFFPMTPEAASRAEFVALPFNRPLEISASWGQGPAKEIIKHGKNIEA